MANRQRRLFETLPGILGAVLPSVACPACWPAYAGLLSSLGIGVFLNGPYFLMVVSVLLGVTVLSLGYRCRSRRGFGPLVLGTVAAVVILAAKLVGTGAGASYAAAGVLIAASVWNNWHRSADLRVATGCAHDCCATPTLRDNEDS